MRVWALPLTLSDNPPPFLHYRRFEALMQVQLLAILTAFIVAGIFPNAFGQLDNAELSIAVLPKGTDRERWNAIHEGASKASEELESKGVRVKILWKGDAGTSRDKQIQVVDKFTGDKG